jgi:hypothetical protein
MADPRTLLTNLLLLLALLVCAAVLVLLLIAACTGFNLARWRQQKKQAATEEHRRRFRADGSPLPPTSRGICEVCQGVFEDVYVLPSGERRCRRCFEKEHPL